MRLVRNSALVFMLLFGGCGPSADEEDAEKVLSLGPSAEAPSSPRGARELDPPHGNAALNTDPAGACSEHEGDDEPVSAVLIELGGDEVTTLSGVACPGDADWIGIDLEAGEEIVLQVNWQCAVANALDEPFEGVDGKGCAQGDDMRIAMDADNPDAAAHVGDPWSDSWENEDFPHWSRWVRVRAEFAGLYRFAFYSSGKLAKSYSALVGHEVYSP